MTNAEERFIKCLSTITERTRSSKRKCFDKHKKIRSAQSAGLEHNHERNGKDACQRVLEKSSSEMTFPGEIRKQHHSSVKIYKQKIKKVNEAQE